MKLSEEIKEWADEGIAAFAPITQEWAGEVVELEAELAQCLDCCKRVGKLEAERDAAMTNMERLMDVLPCPDKLIQLAAWIDLKHPEYDDDEVQEDLRRWGYSIKQALDNIGQD